MIAERAAEGLSNKEIAAGLNISAGTVKHHLGNVYRDLQIQGRGKLAGRLAPHRPRGPQDWLRLGERERAVAIAFVKGEKPLIIARRIGCSPRTVFVYLWNARRTVGVPSNAALGFFIGSNNLAT